MTGYYDGTNKYRARCQTMNTVGAEASIGSAYKYIHLQTYIMLCYTRAHTYIYIYIYI
jgi:hypothetical protein